MPLYHTVSRGECLWSLAAQYLGSGARWPEIYDTHNKTAAEPNQHPPLMPILNKNLIFVGQTIMLPPRQKYPPPGTGTATEGKKYAQPFDLKVSYAIGRDTPPIQYVLPSLEFTVKTELSGDIGLEITSDHMRRHSIELAMSKNPMQAKQKLGKIYDPALCALTAKPMMTYESGKVKIDAPIGTAANVGTLTANLQAKGPNHMSGSIAPPTLSGTVNVKGTNYKFIADISLSVDVIWHPKPNGVNEAPVRAREPLNIPKPKENRSNSMDWKAFGAKITWTILGTALMMMGCKQLPIRQGATSVTPFMHVINPGSSRNRGAFNNDA